MFFLNLVIKFQEPTAVLFLPFLPSPSFPSPLCFLPSSLPLSFLPSVPLLKKKKKKGYSVESASLNFKFVFAIIFIQLANEVPEPKNKGSLKKKSSNLSLFTGWTLIVHSTLNLLFYICPRLSW